MRFGLFIIIGLTFAPLAAAIAFLITYQEYRKHKFEGWKLWKPSLQAALFTFAIFFGLALLIGYLLGFVIQ